MTELREPPPRRRPTGSVVIPAYNEAANIANSLRLIARVLVEDVADRDWEVIVLDDGSVDDTAVLAAKAVSALDLGGISVKVFQHAVNRGLGAALQSAIAASTGDVVVIVDCDLSYSPEHIPKLVRALETERAQVALASPYMNGGSTLGVPRAIERRSRLANAFLARVSNSPLHTLTGMVRAYDGAFVRSLALRSSDDVINIEALYKAGVLRARVVEVPAVLDWREITERASRTRLRNKRTRTKTYHTVVSGLLFRPYMVFAGGGFVLFCLGAMLGLTAMLLPGMQLGLTVLGVCMLVTGISCGLLSLLSVQVKRCFEELYFLQSKARNHLVRATEYRLAVPFASPGQQADHDVVVSGPDVAFTAYDQYTDDMSAKRTA
jgi:glycosyltransferase involved in cell wall biosynthesis